MSIIAPQLLPEKRENPRKTRKNQEKPSEIQEKTMKHLLKPKTNYYYCPIIAQ